MKKLITGAVGLFLAASLAACGGGSGSGGTAASGDGSAPAAEGNASNRVALIAKANSTEYWITVREGAEKAGEDLGVEVSYNGPDTESEGDKQLNQLETVINDKPLGVGFAPQDGAQDGAPRLMEMAEAAGIPVVIFDTPLATSDIPITTVGSDNKAMAAEAAEHMVELIGGSGTLAIVSHGEVGTAALRRDGFVEYIEQNAPDVEIVDIQNGESDPAKSRDKAQAILQAHPDLSGMFGTDDDSIIAIADEVAAKGFDTKVVGFDYTTDVGALITEGRVHGAMVQDPFQMGYQTVELLVAASKGEMPAEKSIATAGVWVTKDNMDTPEVKQVTGG